MRVVTPAQTVGITNPACVCTALCVFRPGCITAGAAGMCGVCFYRCADRPCTLNAGENDDEDSDGMSDWEEDNGEDGGEGDEAMSDDGDGSSVSGVSSEEVRLHPARAPCCAATRFRGAATTRQLRQQCARAAIAQVGHSHSCHTAFPTCDWTCHRNLQEDEMMVGRDAHPAEDDFEHGLQDMHGAGDPSMGLIGGCRCRAATLATRQWVCCTACLLAAAHCALPHSCGMFRHRLRHGRRGVGHPRDAAAHAERPAHVPRAHAGAALCSHSGCRVELPKP